MNDAPPLPAADDARRPALPRPQKTVDLAQLSEQILIQTTLKTNPFTAQISRDQLTTLRQDLTGQHPTPLETLLIERVVACWLQMYLADTLAAAYDGPHLSQMQHNARMQHQAHARYLSAIKTLAQVRNLLAR